MFLRPHGTIRQFAFEGDIHELFPQLVHIEHQGPDVVAAVVQVGRIVEQDHLRQLDDGAVVLALAVEDEAGEEFGGYRNLVQFGEVEQGRGCPSLDVGTVGDVEDGQQCLPYDAVEDMVVVIGGVAHIEAFLMHAVVGNLFVEQQFAFERGAVAVGVAVAR